MATTLKWCNSHPHSDVFSNTPPRGFLSRKRWVGEWRRGRTLWQEPSIMPTEGTSGKVGTSLTLLHSYTNTNKHTDHSRSPEINQPRETPLPP